MTPKEECEQLLAALLPFAEQQLTKCRGFYPYGAVVHADTTLEFTAVTDEGEHPEPAEVIEQLSAMHKTLAEQGQITVSGIVWDGRYRTADGTKSDAVFVSLEHRDGYSVVVGQPYRTRLLRKPVMGELFAQPGLHKVFPEPEDADGEAPGLKANRTMRELLK